MPRPVLDWRRLLTADLDPVRLGGGLGVARQLALAAAVALPGLFWALDWRLLSLWLAEALAVAALVTDRSARPAWRHTLLIPALVFAAVITLAAFTARYPVLAWHGAFDRQDGAFTLFGYLALAVLPPLLLSRWAEARPLLGAVLVFVTLQAAFALVQFFGAVPGFITAHLPGWYWQAQFAEGLFNSPALAASAFALGLAAAGCLYAAGGSRWHLGAAAILTPALLATLTRGAWLGVVLALAVGLFLLRGRLSGRRLAALAAVCLVAAAAITATAPNLRKKLLTTIGDLSGATLCVTGRGCPADTAESIPVEPDYNSVVQRVVIYQVGLQAVLARPWLGWGPDSFEVAWNALRDRSTLYTFGLLYRVDKAHSDLLQVAVSTGLAGLAAYLWLLFAAGRLAGRGAGRPGREGAERVAVAAGALAFWLASQVTITHVSAAPLFWLCLGLLAVAPDADAMAVNPTTH